MTLKKSKIPHFKNRREMAEWWDTHDVADHLDQLKPVNVKFSLGKPKEETIMFRLNKDVKQYFMQVARNKGLTISSLLRMWMMEKFNQIQKAS